MPYTPGGRQDYKAILIGAFDKAVNPNKIKSELSSIASFGKSYIFDAAPKRTGYLASQTDCQVVGPYSILLESKADYSDYVNSGTSRQKPNYFFDRSAKAVEDRIMSMLKTIGK